MENKFGIVYQMIISLVIIIGSILVIIYRKKFLALQKKYFSKQKDYFNQKINQSLESRSNRNSYTLIVVIAIFLIVVASIQLWEVFSVYT